MPTPPKPLNFRMEMFGDDVPEWAQTLIEQLNAFSSQTITAIASVPELEFAGNKSFTTDSSGAAYVDLSNPYNRKPRGVALEMLVLDGTATPPSAPYGFGWSMVSSSIRCLLTGLEASTKYRLTVSIK